MKFLRHIMVLLALAGVLAACGGRGAPTEEIPKSTVADAKGRVGVERPSSFIDYRSLTDDQRLLLDVAAERRALSNLRFRPSVIAPERFEARLEEYDVSWTSDGVWCVNVAAQSILSTRGTVLVLQPCGASDETDEVFGLRTIMVVFEPTFLHNAARQGESVEVLRALRRAKARLIGESARAARVESQAMIRAEVTQISAEMVGDQLVEIESAKEYMRTGEVLEQYFYALHQMRSGFQVAAVYKVEADEVDSETALQVNLGVLERLELRPISEF